jgi:hypothetical protein
MFLRGGGISAVAFSAPPALLASPSSPKPALVRIGLIITAITLIRPVSQRASSGALDGVPSLSPTTVACGFYRGLWCAGTVSVEGIGRAASMGDLAEVERLVGQEPGLLNARDGIYRQTPLMRASYWGHLAVARWLVDKGAAINKRDNAGRTALYCACSHGHAPVVRFLVEKGADPSIGTTWGWSTLIAASDEGNVEVVRFLLGLSGGKASIHHRSSSGDTVLFRACYMGNEGVARLLLASGADPTIATNDGTTSTAIAKQHHLSPTIREARPNAAWRRCR